MKNKKNTRKFREDLVVYQICLWAKQNQQLYSRLANLLHPSKISRHIAGYESRITHFC